MRKQRVLVLGATGLVGSTLLQILEERNFPVDSLRLLGTARSEGTIMNVFGDSVRVEPVTPGCFKGIDICFFAASADAARVLARQASDNGAVVIDKSNAFRMDTRVPLVVPEVNSHHLERHRGIVGSPNCSTIQMVVALWPLEKAARLRRVVAVTYQSVSGTGKQAMQELSVQSEHVLEGRAVRPQVYPAQIAFNLIPHIDDFGEEAYTGEEWKMVKETQKILDRPDLVISPTCVRVPVFVGHSEAVLCETEKTLTPTAARDLLSQSPSIEILDDPDENLYPLPVHVASTDKVYVGRLRKDLSSPNGLWLWIVADNLRKGAALNAVQIAERLIEMDLL